MTESDNADLFEAGGKSILRFLNVFITICCFKEDLQIAKKLNLSSGKCPKTVPPPPPFIIFFKIPCLCDGEHKSGQALHLYLTPSH